MKLEVLIGDMVKRNVSDLHIRVGQPPTYRINGKLFRLKTENISLELINSFLEEIMNKDHLREYETRKETDFAIGFPGVGRFRVNVYSQRNTPALAIRSVSLEVPTFESLGLPEIIRDLSLKRRGLILVTGATGSGKSTTLAAIIDHINDFVPQHIITIEDPIEFLHQDKHSIISQRELGQDTHNFSGAIRAALRQDPDVIMVGEIRDYETMSVALTAANTGHMVLSTLHTMSAVETISRVVSFFPAHEHNQVRLLLSSTLVAAISMRLLPTKDGKSMVPACEILVNNANIKELLIKPDSSSQIMAAIQEGATQYGSQSFDQAILRLYQDDVVALDTALRNASNPDDFELKVRGIEGTSDRSWTGI